MSDRFIDMAGHAAAGLVVLAIAVAPAETRSADGSIPLGRLDSPETAVAAQRHTDGVLISLRALSVAIDSRDSGAAMGLSEVVLEQNSDDSGFLAVVGQAIAGGMVGVARRILSGRLRTGADETRLRQAEVLLAPPVVRVG